MTPSLHSASFCGGILQRGFCLYIWEITPPEGGALYYGGRTGDSSPTNGQSPFNRMGQHLGFAENNNMLRRHLGKHSVEPERCGFRFVALGPLEEESKAESRDEHDDQRDRFAAMEKALPETLTAARCRVIKRVVSRKLPNGARLAEVRTAFATAFPHLVKHAAAALPGVDL